MSHSLLSRARQVVACGGYDVTHRFENREELFDIVGAQIADREVLYLEFGVFTGQATR
jgi:hypothetical protein